MTKKDLFRAIGQVRDDQVLEAAGKTVARPPWRRYLTAAACAAVVLAAALAVPSLHPFRADGSSTSSGAAGNTAPTSSSDNGAQAGSGDGQSYWVDGQEIVPAPTYSTGAEIGQLAGPGVEGTGTSSTSDSQWLPPEEILAQDTVIFRGTVRELQYYTVQLGGTDLYYTKALVEVTDCIRGGLGIGDICGVLYPGVKGYVSTSLSGPLTDLDAGSDAVFMPTQASPDTGWRNGNSYFCYADLAGFYLSEGMRYVFADTGSGLDFERSTYPDLADAETLDQVMDYLRENAPRQDTSPETPEEVFRAAGEAYEGPSPADPAAGNADTGPKASGPAGAREAEPGAVSGEKPAG